MKQQPWFWPVKLFLKRISGKELWLGTEVRVEADDSADWTYAGNRLDTNSIVYSLGVGNSIDFDLDVIERSGATVFAFDPTPYSMEWVEKQELPSEFVFKPWAVAGSDGSLRLYRRINRHGKSAEIMWTADEQAGDPKDFIDAPAYTIATIMELLQHENVDLLKIDVEGAEYDILDGLKSAKSIPHQLLVEFHHRFLGIGKQRTAASIAMLNELGYKIFALSETGREVGFILDQEQD
jgi:FkbM family methyltransferase